MILQADGLQHVMAGKRIGRDFLDERHILDDSQGGDQVIALEDEADIGGTVFRQLVGGEG